MAMVLLSEGPLGRILREHPELRAAAEPRGRAALTARRDSARPWLNAATWVVTAQVR